MVTSMALCETRSKAPTPSRDKIVAVGSRSVSVCNTYDTHSQPARVLNAYWQGAVASLPPMRIVSRLQVRRPTRKNLWWQRGLRHGTRDLCPCPTPKQVGSVLKSFPTVLVLLPAFPSCGRSAFPVPQLIQCA